MALENCYKVTGLVRSLKDKDLICIKANVNIAPSSFKSEKKKKKYFEKYMKDIIPNIHMIEATPIWEEEYLTRQGVAFKYRVR